MKTMIHKPPMGWNSYDYYDTTVNEEQVRANAKYMAANLKEYGWEYIVVDIAWYSYEAGQQRDQYQYVPFAQVEMDEYSRLLPCVSRFPSSADGKGFGPLAEYVHSLGLKFGIHIMRGIPRQAAYLRTAIKNSTHTANEIANPYSICYWNPDMYGVNPKAEGAQEYYDSLLELYAKWGVDFIKCDDICRMDAASSKEEIVMLKKAIERCGRDIVLSLSPGPAILAENDFYQENANMWRITDDFWDHWEALRDMFDRCRSWQEFVADGGYPDCDMLPLGFLGKGFGKERETNFTREEQKTMMTLWCIFRSPLMLGGELTKLKQETLRLITNRELLHMIEATEGARECFRDDTLIAWNTKERESGRDYLAIFNITEKEQTVVPTMFLQKKGNALDVWSGDTCSLSEMQILPAHGAILLKLEG
ncbi:MAG: glycoside hydrolase family 27 protein [Roseburia sp.]|nr:glycoside hydrolase family 27 protein [Roseburia sp.]